MVPDTVPHVAAAAAQRWPSDIAIIDQGEEWTFAMLWSRARAAAAAFHAAEIGKGDRIAIWAPNSRDWIVVALGAMIVGAAIVPMNTRLKGREAGDILRRTGACYLFTVGVFLGIEYPILLAEQKLPALQKIILFDHDFAQFIDSGMGRGGAEGREVVVDQALATLTSTNISDIMFTSGTTGISKGVVSTHKHIVPMFRHWVEVMGLGAGDRYLIINPFFHSFGYKAGWVAALIAGATIVPMTHFDIPEAIRHIEENHISFLPGPPTIYQALLTAKAEQDFDISSLRGAATGAASVPPALIRRMRSELGLRDVVTAYGMTECATITSCRRGDDPALIATSVGKAIPGLEVKIADGAGCELPRGDVGEIHVRGYGVMQGYLDDSEATAMAIDSAGWLHTGDIGTMDAAGYVRITDRMKDMYISGGFNCYPAEIEALLSAHSDIAMVAVIGVADEAMGEVGKAFIVPRPDTNPQAADILTWARAEMANYKLPREIEFVAALPLNASGKVMKEQLRARMM